MNRLKPHAQLPSDAAPAPQPPMREVSAIRPGASGGEQDSPSSPSALCTALFFALTAAIVGVAILLPSNCTTRC